MGIFQNRGENKKYLKPPPSYDPSMSSHKIDGISVSKTSFPNLPPKMGILELSDFILLKKPSSIWEGER